MPTRWVARVVIRETRGGSVKIAAWRPSGFTGVREWVAKLRDRFGGAPIAVAVELAHGPIVSALLEHDIFVLFPIHPSTLAKYRSAFRPSGAKDDPTDAEIALELLLRHRDKLTPLRHPSSDMRSLRRLVESRRDLVVRAPAG